MLCLGCGGPTGEPTYPVTGTVKVNGAPAEGVAVSFVPDGDGGQCAVGVTDAAGKYSLTTRKKDDGAVVGRYKVGFAKYQGPPPTAAEPAKMHADYDVSNEYPPGYNPDAVPETPPAKNLLPAKLADPLQSGFAAEVKPESNTLDFDLRP
jgi:hypothetical protein